MATTSLLVGLRLDLSDATRLASHAKLAEAVGVDLVALDDPPGAPGSGPGLDPVDAAGFVAALTRTPALLVTAATTHAEPFHLSNRLSSLDWGSSGRAGWLATVDPTPERAAAYGMPVPDIAAAHREAAEVVDVVRHLWDSWEDGALISDAATGRFLDSDKLHYTDEAGGSFTVRGPALMPRPPQGRPPVFARPADAHAVGADVLLGEAGTESSGRPLIVEVEVRSTDQLVADLGELSTHADGVLLRPLDGDGVEDLLRGSALKQLEAERLWCPAWPGRTLRDRLGLARPASRFAAGSAQAS